MCCFAKQDLKQSDAFVEKLSKILSEASLEDTLKSCLMFINILSAYADCNSDVFGDTTWLLKYFPKLAVLDPRKVDVSNLPILDAAVIPPEIRDPIFMLNTVNALHSMGPSFRMGDGLNILTVIPSKLTLIQVS